MRGREKLSSLQTKPGDFILVSNTNKASTTAGNVVEFDRDSFVRYINCFRILKFLRDVIMIIGLLFIRQNQRARTELKLAQPKHIYQ